jgi:hypothetical protein
MSFLAFDQFARIEPHRKLFEVDGKQYVAIVSGPSPQAVLPKSLSDAGFDAPGRSKPQGANVPTTFRSLRVSGGRFMRPAGTPADVLAMYAQADRERAAAAAADVPPAQTLEAAPRFAPKAASALVCLCPPSLTVNGSSCATSDHQIWPTRQRQDPASETLGRISPRCDVCGFGSARKRRRSSPRQPRLATFRCNINCCPWDAMAPPDQLAQSSSRRSAALSRRRAACRFSSR